MPDRESRRGERPVARDDRPRLALGVEIDEVTDGFVVYHRVRDRAHYVNGTAALLLFLCDGSRSAADLAVSLAEAFDLPEPPSSEVNRCLADLIAEELLTV